MNPRSNLYIYMEKMSLEQANKASKGSIMNGSWLAGKQRVIQSSFFLVQEDDDGDDGGGGNCAKGC